MSGKATRSEESGLRSSGVEFTPTKITEKRMKSNDNVIVVQFMKM